MIVLFKRSWFTFQCIPSHLSTLLRFVSMATRPDGNESMYRLVLLLMLYRFDYVIGRYINLERSLPCSISDVAMACPGVSHAVVRRVLRAIKFEGVIFSTGKGYGAK